jgi:hypothetical protein
MGREHRSIRAITEVCFSSSLCSKADWPLSASTSHAAMRASSPFPLIEAAAGTGRSICDAVTLARDASRPGG